MTFLEIRLFRLWSAYQYLYYGLELVIYSIAIFELTEITQ